MRTGATRMLRSSFWSTRAAITAAAGTGSPDPCNLIFMFWLPDLRGHGDSDWTKGGSYSLTEYVYDLSCLMRHTGARQVAIVGHSMGGMVGLIYAGTFPDQVSALVILDGVTVLPNAKRAPAHERMAKWVGQLDKLEDREPRRYRTIEEAAAQVRACGREKARNAGGRCGPLLLCLSVVAHANASTPSRTPADLAFGGSSNAHHQLVSCPLRMRRLLA